MAIKIGHASGDENGKLKGGAAGDQTGKEVCIREWYARGWNVVLRPKKADLAEKAARFVEAACANNNIGYDQNQRNTLYKQAKANNFDASKINVKCECDCSSLMHVAAIAGGANLKYGSNGYTTRDMVEAYVASGDYEKLTASKYLSSGKYLRRGDVLVKENGHTAIALENGSASGSSAETTSGSTGSATTAANANVKSGQKWLNSYYGDLLKKELSALLAEDGKFGAKSRAAAVCVWKDLANRKFGVKLTPANANFLDSSKTAAKKVKVQKGDSGTFTLILQFILAAKGFYSGLMDAQFGNETEKAVIAFKKANNLGNNAEVNENVWHALFN